MGQFLGAALIATGVVVVLRSGLSGAEIRAVAWTYVGVALVMTGVSVALALAVPRGGRSTPAVLAGIGVLVLLSRRGWVGSVEHWWVLLGLAFAIVGIYLLTRIPLATSSSIDPVRSIRAYLFPRHIRFVGHTPPSHLRLGSYGTVLSVDLAHAPDGSDGILELSITTVAGRVDLRLPHHWKVLPGRLVAGDSLHMEGGFDDHDPDQDPIQYLGSSDRAAINESFGKRAASLPAGSKAPYPVVLNVSGSFAYVSFTNV